MLIAVISPGAMGSICAIDGMVSVLAAEAGLTVSYKDTRVCNLRAREACWKPAVRTTSGEIS